MQFIKDYLFPIAVTSILHISVVIAMFFHWESAPLKPVIKRPTFVQAKLVMLESKIEKKSSNSKPQPKIVDLTKKKKEQERKKRVAEQKRKKAIDLKKETEKKQKLKEKGEAEAKRKAEVLRQEQLSQQRQKDQKAFEQALKNEQLALMEESYAVAAQSYMAAIAQRIEQNWSRPPSARNGMECELKIQLVPTGRVIGVDVIRGSGNAQFDRSAEQAVKKVEQFPEIKQMKSEVFEKYYRELTLVFRPQDLRQ